MNINTLQEWMTLNTATPGLLALGVFAPGQESLIESSPNMSGVLPQALQKSWRAVTETISVLQLNRFPTARFRFIFGNALVHCERRRDGACLGIFAQKDPSTFSTADLDRLLGEFHSI